MERSGTRGCTTIDGRMPNFTLSEILTIALVILIVFGPDRLPELAKKTGAMIRRARRMMDEVRREFEDEVGDVAAPLRDLSDEIKGVRGDMTSTLRSINDEVAQAKRDIDAEIEEVADLPTGGSADAEGSDWETPDGEGSDESETGA